MPAQLLEEWRPGFAKRAPNFEDVCSRALSWEGSADLSLSRLYALIILGTPDLSMGERLVLLAYAAHLNAQAVREGRAHVWPSTRLIAKHLGCSPSTVRGYTRALEAKGFMVRDYNHANRPAGEHAFDLAPTLAQVADLELSIADLRQAHRAEREAWQRSVVDLSSNRAQAPESQHLEQPPENPPAEDVTQVETASAAPPRPRTHEDAPHSPACSSKPPPSPTAVKGSPERAVAEAEPSPASLDGADNLRAELVNAVTLSEEIRAVVPQRILHNPRNYRPEDLALWRTAAGKLLPEDGRDHRKTFDWAFERHGARALAFLALAVALDHVDNPARYFGWLARSDPREPIDLTLNFRLARNKALAAKVADKRANQPPGPSWMNTPPPGSDHPLWARIAALLKDRVPPGPYSLYFRFLGFEAMDNGILTVTTPTDYMRHQVEREAVPTLIEAAQEIGEHVDRVIVLHRPRS